jgi:hypothetical protein
VAVCDASAVIVARETFALLVARRHSSHGLQATRLLTAPSKNGWSACGYRLASGSFERSSGATNTAKVLVTYGYPNVVRTLCPFRTQKTA